MLMSRDKGSLVDQRMRAILKQTKEVTKIQVNNGLHDEPFQPHEAFVRKIQVPDNNRRISLPSNNKDIELKVQLIRRLARKRWRQIGNRIAASLREFKVGQLQVGT